MDPAQCGGGLAMTPTSLPKLARRLACSLPGQVDHAADKFPVWS
jgi:hypothetical protein